MILQACDERVMGRINRNILECKLGKVDVEAAELKRINRNILECK